MRSINLLRSTQGGDLMLSVVWLAIVQANVAHLDTSPTSGTYGSVNDIPPDAVRRPVSVLAVADMVGLPYETARRYVKKLIAAGQCCRTPTGLIVPASTFDDPVRKEMVTANLVNLKRLYRALAAHGVRLG